MSEETPQDRYGAWITEQLKKERTSPFAQTSQLVESCGKDCKCGGNCKCKGDCKCKKEVKESKEPGLDPITGTGQKYTTGFSVVNPGTNFIAINTNLEKAAREKLADRPGHRLYDHSKKQYIK